MRIANFKINRILAMLILIGLIIGLPGLTLTKAHAKSDIPAYTGTASVVLNGNVPTFVASEITTGSMYRTRHHAYRTTRINWNCKAHRLEPEQISRTR